MEIPILGIVENMSWFECSECGKRHYPFGKSKLEETARKYGLDILARLPINPENADACDHGKIEDIKSGDIASAAAIIESKLQ